MKLLLVLLLSKCTLSLFNLLPSLNLSKEILEICCTQGNPDCCKAKESADGEQSPKLTGLMNKLGGNLDSVLNGVMGVHPLLSGLRMQPQKMNVKAMQPFDMDKYLGSWYQYARTKNVPF